MKNYKAIKEVCKAFVRGFDEIEKHIMAWGREEKSLQKDLQALLALNEDERYPERYGGRSAANYLLSLILTSPQEIRKLHTKHEPVLRTNAQRVLSFWEEHPAFWLFFAIGEILQDDFLTIIDLFSGDEHLLYSPGVCEMQKSGETRGKHYIALMFGNGECLQTAGIIRFNSLSAPDFVFYCGLFGPQRDFDSIINTHYPRFFMLDEISASPSLSFEGQQMEHVWQDFTLSEFAVDHLGGTWSSTSLGELTRYSLEEPAASMRLLPNGDLLFTDSPLMGVTLYRNARSGAMALHTNAIATYAIFRSLLNETYPKLSLPEKPAIAIARSLRTLVDRMGFDLPWSAFLAIRDFAEVPDGEKDEELDRSNLLLQEYMEAKNRGKSFDHIAFSKRTGMVMDEVIDLIDEVNQHLDKSLPNFEVGKKDKRYELSGWPVPPAFSRRLFDKGLKQSGLFTLDEGPMTLERLEALTGGAFKNEIGEIGVVAFVEEMFIDYFGSEIASVLMNTSFWILFHKGKDWLPARSYAIEILKLFPYLLDEDYPDGESFFEDFSLFTRRLLTTRGICTLKARPSSVEVRQGTYLIKGSDAFYSLVEGVTVP